jgi:hypothetical protein
MLPGREMGIIGSFSGMLGLVAFNEVIGQNNTASRQKIKVIDNKPP